MHCVHSKTFQFKLFNQKILATVVEQLLLEQFCIRFLLKGMSMETGQKAPLVLVTQEVITVDLPLTCLSGGV